ncbi:maleylacetoacetate isomerase [Bradyrhizobium sp. SSBR45G]|uniref:maleylacetoacetate isomerase n=1 Tax=unclassified Bradyrhizobium TaxID=2631580 RepID=UPI0023429656|nr:MULTISPECIES: maleylacetoacetate isomerase [unclassified Bradyrhizobium]GLH78559.1 maleylacetoacetate isomerase [Bradyrhizobium sp. SSBR45G]GLH86343.1 maleylacetoacetate isomerase [Bradyrhizobium sp. SSBR45R]
MKLYSFWRSLASFRVRIALNLKGVAYELVPVDIDRRQHRGEAYAALNPQMALPSLELEDGTVLTQSLAILDYLDEVFPAPALLPADAKGRARVRALAAMIACDAHPLTTPRVQRYLTEVLHVDDRARTAWLRHWAAEMIVAVEAQLAGHAATGRFCHGDAPTTADICLAGHVTFALNQGLDLASAPTLRRVFEAAMVTPAFASAHPLAQPDAPDELRRRPVAP